MKTYEISGVERESLGKKETKLLRSAGLVPCVIYGGEKVIHFSAEEAAFKHAIYTPNVYIMNITIGEKVIKAIIQDVQFHPVTDSLLHVDFLEINDAENVNIEIPVKLNGFAKGVAKGGKLQLSMRRLRVSGLLANLPDELNIDVTDVELGKSIKVGELNFENLDILNAKNAVVCTVKLTRAARAAAKEEKAAAAGGKKKK
ncbi:MAG: 50S ribosomal protein L25/general stress protein Ctc [Bacteroidales bacterium]|nr:50S ribosomal protein L25/general stress protein Ctc [Bacteroidales bacterium]